VASVTHHDGAQHTTLAHAHVGPPLDTFRALLEKTEKGAELVIVIDKEGAALLHLRACH
jgi:hypothetical protein